MKPIYLDTETTGLDPDARVVQLAIWDGYGKINSIKFKPPIPISFRAMAVHHITEADVASCPVLADSPDTAERIRNKLADRITVMHNAKFDIMIMANEGIEIGDHICTMKVARRMYPDAESHSMQSLRYELGLDGCGDAHDARGDVITLKALMHRMLKDRAETDTGSLPEALAEWVEWSKVPSLLLKMPFGKYAGEKFEEIKAMDLGYLEWIVNKSTIEDEDVKFTAERWLDEWDV